MKIHDFIKVFGFIAFVAALGLSLAVAANSEPANDKATPETTKDNNMTMYLGAIKVIGEKNIVKTLQAIKIGLEQPYSSDPKLANVVVCRLEDQAGSHVKQWLTCATNRDAARRRDALHTSMTTATAQNFDGRGCASLGCYENVFAALTETLNSQPGHTIHTSVNGPALHQLLGKIPYPKGYTLAPTSTTVPATRSHD